MTEYKFTAKVTTLRQDEFEIHESQTVSPEDYVRDMLTQAGALSVEDIQITVVDEQAVWDEVSKVVGVTLTKGCHAYARAKDSYHIVGITVLSVYYEDADNVEVEVKDLSTEEDMWLDNQYHLFYPDLDSARKSAAAEILESLPAAFHMNDAADVLAYLKEQADGN